MSEQELFGGESLLDLHLDTVPDPHTVPGGEEYQLRISNAKIQQTKTPGSSRKVIKVVCAVEGEPLAKSIFINHAMPLPEDEKEKAYMMKLQIKKFFQCFDIDLANPGKPEEWKGKLGWVILKETKTDAGEEINEVSTYITKK